MRRAPVAAVLEGHVRLRPPSDGYQIAIARRGLERDAAAERALERVERWRPPVEAQPLPEPVLDILTPDELEDMRRTTPQPRPPAGGVTDADLADAIASAWKSRWGKPTVVAEAELAKLRRGGSR